MRPFRIDTSQHSIFHISPLIMNIYLSRVSSNARLRLSGYLADGTTALGVRWEHFYFVCTYFRMRKICCALRLLTRSKYFSRNILFSRKIVFCIRRYYKLPLRDVVRLKSRESCTCVALPTKTQKLGPNYAKIQIWNHFYPLLKLCSISRSSTITPARQLICIPPPCDGVSGALTAVWQIGSSFGYLEAPPQCR